MDATPAQNGAIVIDRSHYSLPTKEHSANIEDPMISAE
jgi:hypothetical protein